MPPILKAISLSHRFDYPLFENISLSLNKNESIAIVGVSGSGKSTLLHILATLLPPKKGEVLLFGENIYSLDEKKRLLIRRQKLGIVFQSHYLFKGLTARENIEAAAILAKTEVDNDLLKRFRIEHVMDKKVTALSGGEQQRVSIARVLTKRPEIIFADEPTGNLDKKTAIDVMESILEWVKEDGALVLVTHDMHIAQMCDQIYELKDGLLSKVLP